MASASTTSAAPASTASSLAEILAALLEGPDTVASIFLRLALLDKRLRRKVQKHLLALPGRLERAKHSLVEGKLKGSLEAEVLAYLTGQAFSPQHCPFIMGFPACAITANAALLESAGLPPVVARAEAVCAQVPNVGYCTIVHSLLATSATLARRGMQQEAVVSMPGGREGGGLVAFVAALGVGGVTFTRVGGGGAPRRGGCWQSCAGALAVAGWHQQQPVQQPWQPLRQQLEQLQLQLLPLQRQPLPRPLPLLLALLALVALRQMMVLLLPLLLQLVALALQLQTLAPASLAPAPLPLALWHWQWRRQRLRAGQQHQQQQTLLVMQHQQQQTLLVMLPASAWLPVLQRLPLLQQLLHWEAFPTSTSAG